MKSEQTIKTPNTTKGPTGKPHKKANQAADEAATKAGKTEKNYDEKRGMFTK
jgi:hypothetical protein